MKNQLQTQEVRRSKRKSRSQNKRYQDYNETSPNEESSPNKEPYDYQNKVESCADGFLCSNEKINGKSDSDRRRLKFPGKSKCTNGCEESCMNGSKLSSDTSIETIVKFAADAVASEVISGAWLGLLSAKSHQISKDPENFEEICQLKIKQTNNATNKLFIQHNQNKRPGMRPEEDAESTTLAIGFEQLKSGKSDELKHDGSNNILLTFPQNQDNFNTEALLSEHSPFKTDTSNFQTVALAVKRFAIEIYYPFLLASKDCMNNKILDSGRILVSTLLAIRHMFIMNAEKFFSPRARKNLNEEKPNNNCFEFTYTSRNLANAIVQCASKRVHPLQCGGQLYHNFLKAAANYDLNSNDFQFAMEPLDARSICSLGGRKQLSREESVAARISFNLARETHPLLNNHQIESSIESSDGILKSENFGLLKTPAPTACAVFVFEKEPSDEKSEEVDNQTRDVEQMDSYKTLLEQQRTKRRVEFMKRAQFSEK